MSLLAPSAVPRSVSIALTFPEIVAMLSFSVFKITPGNGYLHVFLGQHASYGETNARRAAGYNSFFVL